MRSKENLTGLLCNLIGKTTGLGSLDNLTVHEVNTCYSILDSMKIQESRESRKLAILDKLSAVEGKKLRLQRQQKDLNSMVLINSGSIVCIDLDNYMEGDCPIGINENDISRIAQLNTVFLVYHKHVTYSRLDHTKLKGMIKCIHVKSIEKQASDMKIHSILQSAYTIGITDLVVISNDRGFDTFSEVTGMDIKTVSCITKLQVINRQIHDYRELSDLDLHSITSTKPDDFPSMYKDFDEVGDIDLLLKSDYLYGNPTVKGYIGKLVNLVKETRKTKNGLISDLRNLQEKYELAIKSK